MDIGQWFADVWNGLLGFLGPLLAGLLLLIGGCAMSIKTQEMTASFKSHGDNGAAFSSVATVPGFQWDAHADANKIIEGAGTIVNTTIKTAGTMFIP